MTTEPGWRDRIRAAWRRQGFWLGVLLVTTAKVVIGGYQADTTGWVLADYLRWGARATAGALFFAVFLLTAMEASDGWLLRRTKDEGS